MTCPICGSNVEVSPERPTPDGRRAHYIECERCGPYFGTEEAVRNLPGMLRGDKDRIAQVAHGVRQMQRGREPAVLTTDLIDRFLEMPLPSVFEQANNLIIWIGEHIDGPGESVSIRAKVHLYVVGASSPAGFHFLVSHLMTSGHLAGTRSVDGSADVTLTFQGWEHFDNLQRGQVESRKAFMAMKYGDSKFDRIVRDVFIPAVAQTGFALSRLDDEPRAGLIDDRLRVQIRNSRFVIADLTHDNLGAHWEAGFAEGLGKPVIYTCERARFEQGTHFDTNHHLTVIWDEGSLDQAAQRLKATIRATLPEVAKLSDE